jgi:hypothetical protein
MLRRSFLKVCGLLPFIKEKECLILPPPDSGNFIFPNKPVYGYCWPGIAILNKDSYKKIINGKF